MSLRVARRSTIGRGHSKFAIWRRIKKTVAAACEELLSLRDARYNALIQEMSGWRMSYD